MNLNLGCGTRHLNGFVNIDRIKYSHVDVLADLEHLPFKSHSIDTVYCRHVLEHVNCFDKVLEEMWRTSSIIEIIVPFWGHAVANNDPEHKRRFGIFSFDNYVIRKHRTCLPNNKARFKIITKKYASPNKLLERLANRFYKFYENNFAGMFPVREIYFKLKVIK